MELARRYSRSRIEHSAGFVQVPAIKLSAEGQNLMVSMNRPYVTLSAAMTLDGKIASIAGDSQISCEADLVRVHRLRANVDAVMVGVGTVLADDPLLTVRRVRGKNPIRVVVDSKASIPLNARVLDRSAPTIIAVAEGASESKVRKFHQVGAKVIRLGGGEVNLGKLLSKLRSMGVRRLMLEGGSTLNWSMFKEGLVDELRIAIAPRIIGGSRAKTLVDGEGFAKVSEGVGLKLLNVRRVGGDLLLIFRVIKGAKKIR